jgi:hypothetical protein
MPNWVTHRIHLTGPTETLRTIKAAHIEVHPNDEDGDSVMGFSFQSLVPMPAVLEPVIASSLMELAVEAITGKSFGEVTQDPIKLHMEQLFRRPGDEAKIQARRDNLTVEQLEMGQLV